MALKKHSRVEVHLSSLARDVQDINQQIQVDASTKVLLASMTVKVLMLTLGRNAKLGAETSNNLAENGSGRNVD